MRAGQRLTSTAPVPAICWSKRRPPDVSSTAIRAARSRRATRWTVWCRLRVRAVHSTASGSILGRLPAPAAAATIAVSGRQLAWPKTEERTNAKRRGYPRQISAAVDAARDKKGDDVVVLDLRKAGAFTDYFVICSGTNARQVQAIADAVEEALKAAEASGPSHVEGYAARRVGAARLLRLRRPRLRARRRATFYGLERLWGNAEHGRDPDAVAAA